MDFNDIHKMIQKLLLFAKEYVLARTHTHTHTHIITIKIVHDLHSYYYYALYLLF